VFGQKTLWSAVGRQLKWGEGKTHFAPGGGKATISERARIIILEGTKLPELLTERLLSAREVVRITGHGGR